MLELAGITWDHPRGYAPLDASVASYARRWGVGVRWERRSLQAFGDLPLSSLAQRYDLLVIDHPHVGEAAGTGCLLPLDEIMPPATLVELAGQSAGPSHNSYAYDGHQWALALDAALQASAYRSDLFAGPLPATWDEALALLRRLRGAAALPLCPTDAVCSFLTLAACLGPAVDGEIVWATGLAALEMLGEFRALSHPACLDWNPIGLLDHMSRNDDVVYCPLAFCYTNYARPGYAPHLLRFAAIPGTRGALLGGAGIAVSAYGRRPDAAAAYAAWLCSAEVQAGLYVEAGGQPGNRLAWEDPRADALTNGFFRAVWPSLATAYVRPRHPGYVAFQEAAGRAIHAFLADGGSAAACLGGLQRLYAEHAVAGSRGA